MSEGSISLKGDSGDWLGCAWLLVYKRCGSSHGCWCINTALRLRSSITRNKVEGTMLMLYLWCAPFLTTVSSSGPIGELVEVQRRGSRATSRVGQLPDEEGLTDVGHFSCREG